MKVKYDQRFYKDLKRIVDRKLKSEIFSVLEEIKLAADISEIFELKFMRDYAEYFRIRVANYRLGCKILPDGTIAILRFMHRADIYKFFP